MGVEDLYDEVIWHTLYACPFCDFKTRDEKEMKEHLKTHIKKPKTFNPTER